MSENASTAEGAALIGRHLVWDNHGCMPIRPQDESFLPQLERYRASGVDVVTLNICWDGTPPSVALPMAMTVRRWVAARPDQFMLVQTAADLDRARASNRLGVLFNVEGGRALEGKLSRVQRFYDLGVRWMLLTYNRRNDLGGGCLDAVDEGLTDFGRAVVDEMCRVGIVPCCTHGGERSGMEVMERSTLPVIFSHSNALSVWQHPRNISDAAIRACARTDGVVGVNGVASFVGPREALAEGIVDHICHIANLVGPRHVGLGLDYLFDPGEGDEEAMHLMPEGMIPAQEKIAPPETLPAVVGGLIARGWHEADIAAFLGGNLRRVASAAWKPVAA